jgi:hypothetical protein
MANATFADKTASDETNTYDAWCEAGIVKELAGGTELLPPWEKFPDIPCFSIAWRIGGYPDCYGASWGHWVGRMDQGQLVAYLRRYVPLPVTWLWWISSCFNCHGVPGDVNLEQGILARMLWMERQGLANVEEFKVWLSEFLQKRID